MKFGAKSYENLVRNRSKSANKFGAKSYEIWCEIVTFWCEIVS